MKKKILFKDLPIGRSLLYNGIYGIKIDATRIHITKLGVDGFIEFEQNEVLEIDAPDEDNNV